MPMFQSRESKHGKLQVYVSGRVGGWAWRFSWLKGTVVGLAEIQGDPEPFHTGSWLLRMGRSKFSQLHLEEIQFLHLSDIHL